MLVLVSFPLPHALLPFQGETGRNWPQTSPGIQGAFAGQKGTTGLDPDPQQKKPKRDDETCPWWMEGTCPLPPLLCVSATSSSPRVSLQVTMALVTSRVLVLVQTCTNTAATAAGWGGGSSVRAPVDIASADSGWLLATVMGNRLELPFRGGGGG